MQPLCHLTVTLGLWQPSRLGLTQDLSSFRLWVSFRVSPVKSYFNTGIQCALNMPSWKSSPGIFAPSALTAPENFLGWILPNSSRTPAWFDYHLSVHRSPEYQVLFHTWGAHGVSLTEPFSRLKAVILSDHITSLPLISWSSINSERRKSNFRHPAMRFCSLRQAVLEKKLLSSLQA
jgi:hypothetical protein